MAEFVYRAARFDGSMVDGRIEAAARELALRQLRAQGLTPVLIEPAAGTAPLAPAAGPAPAAAPATPDLKPQAARSPGTTATRKILLGDRGPNHTDVHHLTGELAIMLRAGLPLRDVRAATTALAAHQQRIAAPGVEPGQRRRLIGDLVGQ